MANLTEAISGDPHGEYDCGTPTAKQKEEKAKFMGLKMVKSNDLMLLLDLDSDAHVEDFERSMGILKEAKYPLVGKHLITISKRGKKHAYVRLSKPLGLMERIGLQAVLGSDRKREALSILELLKGYEEPTVLFETPEGHSAVVKWLQGEGA